MVKTSTSNAGDVGLIPDPGTKYPHASWPKKQNVKQKRHCNKFKKDFENGPLQKKKRYFKNFLLLTAPKGEGLARKSMVVWGTQRGPPTCTRELGRSVEGVTPVPRRGRQRGQACIWKRSAAVGLAV